MHCLDLVVALMQHAMGDAPEEDEDSEGFHTMLERLEERYNQVFSKRAKQTNTITTEELITSQSKASEKIQRLVRWYFVVDNLRELGTSRDLGTRGEGERVKTLNRVERLIGEIAKSREDKDEGDDDEDHDLDSDDNNNDDNNNTNNNNNKNKSPDSESGGRFFENTMGTIKEGSTTAESRL